MYYYEKNQTNGNKRPAKENENEISAGRTAKKYNIGYNSGYTENEKIPKPKYRRSEKSRQ